MSVSYNFVVDMIDFCINRQFYIFKRTFQWFQCPYPVLQNVPRVFQERLLHRRTGIVPPPISSTAALTLLHPTPQKGEIPNNEDSNSLMNSKLTEFPRNEDSGSLMNSKRTEISHNEDSSSLMNSDELTGFRAANHSSSFSQLKRHK